MALVDIGLVRLKRVWAASLRVQLAAAERQDDAAVAFDGIGDPGLAARARARAAACRDRYAVLVARHPEWLEDVSETGVGEHRR